MKISQDISDKAALKEIGARIARYRLNRNMTQEALAQEAGVSTPTIQRLENGSSSQFSNLIRVLRALKLFENLNSLIPEPAVSPIQLAQMSGKVRQRASKPAKPEQPATWSWGDEQ